MVEGVDAIAEQAPLRPAEMVVEKGGAIVGVIVVLFVAWILSGWVHRLVIKGLLKAHVDETMSKFAGKLAKWAILIFAALGCLGKFGVDVTERFAAPLARCADKGWLTVDADAVTLTREGLLRADRLLSEFYRPEHRVERYS